jgi:hypothetical protein
VPGRGVGTSHHAPLRSFSVHVHGARSRGWLDAVIIIVVEVSAQIAVVHLSRSASAWCQLLLQDVLCCTRPQAELLPTAEGVMHCADCRLECAFCQQQARVHPLNSTGGNLTIFAAGCCCLFVGIFG